MTANAIDDFRILCLTLLTLHKLAKNRWKENLDVEDAPLTKSTENNHYEIAKNKLLDKYELEHEIQDNKDSLKLCLEPFLLPPLKRKEDFIPLLKFKCDLSGSSNILSLRVVMCRWIEVKINGKKIRQLSGLGFRFEMGDKAHEYCHAQLISLPGCSHKVSEKFPCIPIVATCPVSLFFCMIVSFYGLKTWSKYFSEITLDKHHKKAIKQILR